MKETVVLLHGIQRTARSMMAIAGALRCAGYQVLSVTYPSTRLDIEGIADWLHQNVLTGAFWQRPEKVHFVTHSMGGLVIRRYLQNYRAELPAGALGRVVMLGAPNNGSEVADFLKRFRLFKKFFGPAGQELSTHHQKSVNESPYYDLGVIAGTARWAYFPVPYLLISGPSDGLVGVEQTKIEGMRDHITIFTSHMLMVVRPAVIRQVIYFIRNGVFKHE